MKRHRNHQIDELAQQVLCEALPATWVANEQYEDYGKDYLVEIGEDNGDLTGSSFFIQLKGQERAEISADGSLVKFSLDSKYARYYSDKIKDLPVFLVVVDVNQRKGWWLFLQPVLEEDQTWRKPKSITVSLPVSNALFDMASFRKAVEEAKKWMRIHHPESIHESVIAHKERIIGTDPRFDVRVSLVDDRPNFRLLPKEKVPLTFTFSGDRDEIGKKLSDLIDKGLLVSFQPGEVRVTGSKIFEALGEGTCQIQTKVDFPSTVTLICHDGEGCELARLSEIPGCFTGGRKELWFDGGLVNSPLSLKIGPIAPGTGGSVQMNWNLSLWDGQLLKQLGYFDRLSEFFQVLPKAVSTTFECQKDGNILFSVSSPLQSQPFAVPLANYLKTLWKARKVAQKFDLNPSWMSIACDQDTLETADQLYGIYFENGWTERTPNVRVNGSCIRKTFNSHVAKHATSPGLVTLTSDCEFPFFGEKIKVGDLVQEFTAMKLKVFSDRSSAKSKKSRSQKRRKVKPKKANRRGTIKIALIGSPSTVMRIRLEQTDSMDPGITHQLLSSQAKISKPKIKQSGQG